MKISAPQGGAVRAGGVEEGSCLLTNKAELVLQVLLGAQDLGGALPANSQASDRNSSDARQGQRPTRLLHEMWEVGDLSLSQDGEKESIEGN